MSEPTDDLEAIVGLLEAVVEIDDDEFDALLNVVMTFAEKWYNIGYTEGKIAAATGKIK